MPAQITCARSTASGSSSTISVRSGERVVSSSAISRQRDTDFTLISARDRTGSQNYIIAKARLEPVADIGEANAETMLTALGYARPVIADGDHQPVELFAGADGNRHHPIDRRNRIFDRIFDQWLQDHAWYARIGEIVGQIEHAAQQFEIGRAHLRTPDTNA